MLLRAAASLAFFVGWLAIPGSLFAQTPPPPMALPPRIAAEPITLDVGAFGGATVRMGDSQFFDVTARGGIVLGGAAWLNPSRRYGLGLEFAHTNLGTERAGPGPLGEVELSRYLNALWAGLRVDLVRADGAEGWLAFGPGLVWESADASGVRMVQFAQPGQAFACAGSAGPRLGLRVGVGGAFALGGGLHVSPEALLEGDQLTTDSVGSCVAGPGTTAVLSFRLGFFYRADVSRRVR